MRIKKILPFVLSCLLLLEPPLVSHAAGFSSADNIMEGISTLAEGWISQADVPASQADTSSDQVDSHNLSLTLNHDEKNLIAGDMLQLTASFFDYDNTGNSPLITWTSDHSDIASVSSQGLITAHKAGSAVITASAVLDTANDTYTFQADCIITVTDTISLNKKKLTLYTSQTVQLKAKTVSGDAVTWQSSDTDIVSVDQKGRLKPLQKGTASITASVNGVSASCKVTVKTPTLKLAASKTVYLDNPVTLKATAAPEGTISWKSSDSKIASVSKKGKVTPKKTGTVTITASCNGLKKSCKVTVKKPSVELTTGNVTVFAENDHTLNAVAHPASKLSYRTSNPKVAKVSKDGVITGVHQGTATITASVPGAKVSCEVTVLKNDHKLNRSSMTLMKGSSATIYMSNIPVYDGVYDSVYYEISDPSIAKLSSEEGTCKVKALHAGKATIDAYYTVYKNDQLVSCKRSCAIKVISSGIVQQQTAVSVGSTQTLTLNHVNKSGADITDTVWTSSDPKIALISKAGKVKGKKFGSVKITASVHYSNGTTKDYYTQLKVSQPKTEFKRTVVPIGSSQKVSLNGLTSYSETTWKLKKKSLASIAPDGTVTAGYKTGKTTLTIKADGKTMKQTIVITNPKLKSSYALLAPGQTEQIKLSGVSAQSKITYKSGKSSVATVSKSGLITARRCGSVNISVTADGNKFTFQLEVAPQRAIDACKTGYDIMYSSTYSQARRMSTGYYDCSSLVFRSYGCNTKLLGGTSSWAPTAASMASYLESKGKVISYSGLSTKKLCPGDLIFYSAPYNNGRYRNIYHVSMYYGNGYRLEKPLRYYYTSGNIVMIARPVD